MRIKGISVFIYFWIKALLSSTFTNTISPTVFKKSSNNVFSIVNLNKSDYVCFKNLFIENLDNKSFSPISCFTIPEYGLIVHENIHVYSEKGIIINKKNQILIRGFFYKEGDSLIDYDLIRHFFKIRKFKQREEAYVISSQGANNYYHWMFDVICKLVQIDENDFERAYFIFQGPAIGFKIDFINLLNIKNYCFTDRNFRMALKKAIVPEFVSKLGIPTMTQINFLKSRLLPKINLHSPNNDKIYISRFSSRRRRITNEAELLPILINFNYKIVYLEELTLLDQVSIFYSASIIIGIHGAGFANLVFCRKDTIVLELFSSNYIEPCYSYISEICNLNYNFAMFEKTNKRDDLKLDLSRFISLLYEIDGMSNDNKVTKHRGGEIRV